MAHEQLTTDERILRELQHKKTNHLLHLIVSIFTGGLWVIPWLVIAQANTSHNRKVDGGKPWTMILLAILVICIGATKLYTG